MLVLRDNEELSRALAARRLQRAIGVIYLPETERVSHYFHTNLPRQFDAMMREGQMPQQQSYGTRISEWGPNQPR